ncbi:hypothetical protein BGZ61DRAFT_483009 [Ilyonectria robusta]|uniref:uncharacterized protein n=1 Tax=Ilyonectria robusta TaxID=1079257 RepID=UPI001E8DA1EF|nr:uncharacterized protein BGZ61DRAFT_483009 [Ilyonectria robusta]KAH8670661.1 hypothetical protein BGZ61DRAFT_483009 [Ilyonectria robusta]
MDLTPERDLNPSARTEQQVHQIFHQPQLVPSRLPPRRASLAIPNEKSVPTNIHKVECWVYDGNHLPSTSYAHGTFTKDEITSWLKAPSPATYNGVKPAAGLRLLCREQETSIKWPFDKATFGAIQEALGLPATVSYLNMPKSGACGKYLGTPGHPIFIFHRSNNNGAISTVLKYDSFTNITSGYALLGPRISLEALCTQIRSQFAQFAHPLLVPTVLIELTATDLMRELYHVNRLLTASEYKTRSGDWEIQDSLANAGPTLAPAPGALLDSWHDEAAAEMQREPPYWAKMSREMAECQDNHQLARILGWMACRFAFMNAAVQCSLSMVEFTRKEMDALETYVVPATRRRLRAKGGAGDVMNSACLRHRVEMLESNLRHMVIFGAIEPRMQAQQTMLFNLINIGMARDSKELAEASKRDSSAMKIIAMLTTLFLPGTFIAAFFAMPILDWNALSMNDVMTNHFWLYWAISIPLTVVVMAVVGAYGRVQAIRNHEAAANARKEAGLKEV